MYVNDHCDDDDDDGDDKDDIDDECNNQTTAVEVTKKKQMVWTMDLLRILLRLFLLMVVLAVEVVVDERSLVIVCFVRIVLFRCSLFARDT